MQVLLLVFALWVFTVVGLSNLTSVKKIYIYESVKLQTNHFDDDALTQNDECCLLWLCVCVLISCSFLFFMSWLCFI